MPIELTASKGAVTDVAVVPHPDLDLIPPNPASVRRLRASSAWLSRKGDADDLHAVMLGRMHGHDTPTAPDIEQPHAGSEVELAVDQLETPLVSSFTSTFSSMSPKNRRRS